MTSSRKERQEISRKYELGKCSKCNGKGSTYQQGWRNGELVDVKVTCPKCYGTGRKNNYPDRSRYY